MSLYKRRANQSVGSRKKKKKSSALKSQMKTTDKANLADIVILTDGNPEFVDQQINQFLSLLK